MMTTTTETAAVTKIVGVDALDTIHAFWMDVEPGRGYVTIICYGCAWTAYFGGMNGQTIKDFFANVDVEYMVSKMGNTPALKVGKKHDVYLGRIVKAVQESLR